MKSKPTYYRGRGFDELYDYVSTNGTLVGEIQRNTGDFVASVEISIQNKELFLEVNGQTFSSITNALSELYPDLAVNDAEGSEGSGNIANNVIGNYAILKHVVFGNVTMEDIVGTASVSRGPRRPRVAKPKKITVTVNINELPASGNLYNFFKADVIKGLAKSMGGAEPFQAYLRGKTIADFARENGLTV
jgi:hypothetical protein